MHPSLEELRTSPFLPPRPSAWAAIRFPFADRNWLVNAMVGVLLMMIPLIGPLTLLGWGAEVTQRLVRRHPEPIPKLELGDLMHYFGRGVAPFVVGLIVQLPILLVTFTLIGGGFAAATMASAALDEPAVGAAVGGAVALCLFPVLLVLGMVASSAHLVAELGEDIGGSLSLARIGGLLRRTAVAQLVQGFVFGILASCLVLVGLALCFVGVYPLAVLLQLAQAHLRVQMYALYLERGGQPFPLAASQVLPSAAVAGSYGAAR